MAQSLARIWTHLIFSTKDRFPYLTDKQIRRDMHAYLATILRKYDCETLIVGGVEDHTHSLFALSRIYPIAKVVKETKRTSSGWVKELSPQLASGESVLVGRVVGIVTVKTRAGVRGRLQSRGLVLRVRSYDRSSAQSHR